MAFMFLAVSSLSVSILVGALIRDRAQEQPLREAPARA
jgi:hypothetical protein